MSIDNRFNSAVNEQARLIALDYFEWTREYDTPIPMGGDLELLTEYYRRQLASMAFGMGLMPLLEQAE